MRSLLLGLACAILLSACSSSLEGIGDAWHFVHSTRSSNNLDSTRLDPKFTYLRITVHGRSTLMVLGYTDPDPHGPIEVWYSAGSEVLRLQNGRVVGSAGLPMNWSSVRYSAVPAWREITAPVTLERTRDVMPNYDFGVQDVLTLAPIKPPSSSDLADLPADKLAWFAESSRTSSARDALPPARYAVEQLNGQSVAVYGEQCFAKSFCLSWQRWPARLPVESNGE
ncbi:YjbF family lipoprotein [Paraburkholderia acidisoli]|uniref:Group 4 capsule polysaccharide lipoprotein GfcB/YjbF n=1 Tax=Paraburkholderia acidisoli TaxID=2571748 RepID=A0A7Z2GF85_9BURK|nr:YjbF family lipoprotein [Paraburkholderia acidisoli]QGZ60693.1 hypothetical protein FAZ98_02475 [Paraburkholderia acidisoli]